MNKLIGFLSCILLFLCGFITISHAEHLEQASASCQLTTLDGKSTYDLHELKGKVVYMDFWASWCLPCVKSFPFLNELDHDLKEQGLHVIGINLDEKDGQIHKNYNSWVQNLSRKIGAEILRQQ